MDIRSEIHKIIEDENMRSGEILLDFDRLHPNQSDEFWSEIEYLCCHGVGKDRKISLATLTFANRSLQHNNLDKLIEKVDSNFAEHADILPYIILMVQKMKRRDLLVFCENAYDWSVKNNSAHIRVNAQRCLNDLTSNT